MKHTILEVGGAVRALLMGVETNDVDFVVLAPSFEEMRQDLVDNGFGIWLETPEFLTIRAHVPDTMPELQARTRDADFVLARKDSATSDGRRPDFVEAASLHEDLARRDFTMNAIARNPLTGEIIDPFGGQDDIANGLIRFVGNAEDRVREDGLRVMRAFRFSVTLGFHLMFDTSVVCVSTFGAEMLMKVSTERIREELNKMLKADTLATIMLLSNLPRHTQDAIFRDGLRLSATMKG